MMKNLEVTINLNNLDFTFNLKDLDSKYEEGCGPSYKEYLAKYGDKYDPFIEAVEKAMADDKEEIASSKKLGSRNRSRAESRKLNLRKKSEKRQQKKYNQIHDRGRRPQINYVDDCSDTLALIDWAKDWVSSQAISDNIMPDIDIITQSSHLLNKEQISAINAVFRAGFCDYLDMYDGSFVFYMPRTEDVASFLKEQRGSTKLPLRWLVTNDQFRSDCEVMSHAVVDDDEYCTVEYPDSWIF